MSLHDDGSWHGRVIVLRRAAEEVSKLMRKMTVLVILATALTLAPATPSSARGCGTVDPTPPTFREMIAHDTTWDPAYPIMILGRVIKTRDLGGAPGGWSHAILRAHAHPIGAAPRMSKIKFWSNEGGLVIEDKIQFTVGVRYVVIARRASDGVFRSDEGCGRTSLKALVPFQRLVRFALDR
jgi:hypothetical protein